MKYMDTRIPSPATVYEYVISPVQHTWQHWDSRLPGSFKHVLPAIVQFFLEQAL